MKDFPQVKTLSSGAQQQAMRAYSTPDSASMVAGITMPPATSLPLTYLELLPDQHTLRSDLWEL